MALPLFAVTLFVSAFILFLVQPIIGKLILPKLGGTPQVWNTCMVFFQTALLAGYAYTHTVSSRLKLKQQLVVHALLLFVPLLILFPFWKNFLPFDISDWRQDNLGGNPIPDALWLLAKVVGIPFLMVATSAPLLQKWFSSTGHPAAKDPYFLYGASNAGSMLALIVYPFAVELYMPLAGQSLLFAGGYCVLVVLVLCCVFLVATSPAAQPSLAGVALDLAPVGDAPAAIPPTEPSGAPLPTGDAPASTAVTSTPPAPTPAPPPPPPAAAKQPTSIKRGAPKQSGKQAAKGSPASPGDISIKKSDEVTPLRRLRWVCLAAVPSSFMLGVTSHITTDLSPMPAFWLIPLTLYLLSFILVYLRWPVTWTEGPHTVVLIAQPFALAIMIFLEVLHLSSDPTYLPVVIFFNVLAFFLTALVCHGELAKDRPTTKYLTEYFLLMSVGGMVGGMFNGLVAPIFFKWGLAEFPIAVFLACLVRPVLKNDGWIDHWLQGMLDQQPAPQQHGKGQKGPHHAVEAPTSYTPLLDVALPIVLLIYVAFGTALVQWQQGARGMKVDILYLYYFAAYGIPLANACFYYARPVRFALAIGAVLLVNSVYAMLQDRSIFADRSYFGIIHVNLLSRQIGNTTYEYTQLIHGHIDHGMNFKLPEKESDWGNPEKDWSRLATTYYHRYGPAGSVMEKFNWQGQDYSAPQNTYHADARLPASVIGLGGVDCLTSLVGAWSEPPYATIGLGTGTMASYARPYQHMHYYEIDNHVRRLSEPGPGQTLYFNYLKRARDRGAIVQVLMGDARLRMALPYVNQNDKEKKGDQIGGGPNNFYHMMVVDAFSSDAIPAHLITKEAIEMYFTKLTEQGILCVHTSNRFVNLPKVVAAVAQNLGLSYTRGRDNAEDQTDIGHTTSEWVMVARKADYLNLRCKRGNFWSTTPAPQARYLWTDDHYNLISVLRLFEKRGDD